MAADSVLREKLATCTRIFAMQGLIGVFGHVSAYEPEGRRVYICPGMGSDKATTTPGDVMVLDPSGQVVEGVGHMPFEWPIHTAVHSARADALAVAHLHAPYATLFSIVRREFRPVTLQGSLFSGGIPLYTEADLITTPAQGKHLAELMGSKRAALLRGHGVVVAGRDLEEVLFASLILEDDVRKAVQAATLGELSTIGAGECAELLTEVSLRSRSRRAWDYFCRLESRWDRQPGTGLGPLA